MVNVSVYHFKALLAQGRKGDLFFFFLMLFWVRTQIAVNSMIVATRHNVIVWIVLLFSLSG